MRLGEAGERADMVYGNVVEIDPTPEYRVSFWPDAHHEEWEIVSEADVHEVFEWAQRESEGRSFAIFARTRTVAADGREEVVEVRLRGVDPPSVADAPPWAVRTE